MIKKEDLLKELLKCTNNIPIKIKRNGDVLTVYVTKISIGNKVWARNISDSQDTMIFPTKNVKILKIGSKEIQSDKSYLEEKKDYFDMKEQERKNKNKSFFIDAYKRNLINPNI